jgi:SAM-dependent methyltransferase
LEKYLKFYEQAGRLYPEDEITYSSLSGLMREKWVLKKLSALPRGNLLDCGCNIGRLSAHWDRGAVFGIDISYSLVNKGRHKYPRTNFIQADLRNVEFVRHGSIDNAMAVEVLEHIDRPGDFLSGLYRIMKKGGVFLVTVPGYSRTRPVLAPLGVIRSFGLKNGPDGGQYLHTAYKPSELGQLLSRAGFTILECGTFEHELRGWVKPLTVISKIFDALSSRYFPVSKLNYMYLKAVHRLELDLFSMLDVFGLSAVLKRIFKEGRRSYVLARK